MVVGADVGTRRWRGRRHRRCCRYQSCALRLGLAVGLAAQPGGGTSVGVPLLQRWCCHCFVWHREPICVCTSSGAGCRLRCRGGQAPLRMPYRAATYRQCCCHFHHQWGRRAMGGSCWHFLVSGGGSWRTYRVLPLPLGLLPPGLILYPLVSFSTPWSHSLHPLSWPSSCPLLQVLCPGRWRQGGQV